MWTTRSPRHLVPVGQGVVAAGQGDEGEQRRVTLERQVERGRQGRCGTRVVGMRMADQDAVDPASAGAEDRVDMVRIVRTGIDHRERAGRAVFHEPGVGAAVGHRTRVVRDDPDDARGFPKGNPVQRYGFAEPAPLPLSQTRLPRA